jgi:hypothetical protein
MRPAGLHSLHFVSARFDGLKQILFLVQVLFGIGLFVSILLGTNYAKELEGCCLRKEKGMVKASRIFPSSRTFFGVISVISNEFTTSFKVGFCSIRVCKKARFFN